MAKKATNKIPPKAKRKAPKKRPVKVVRSNLTPKQEKFCHVYMETGNASEAYRQSYNYLKMKDVTIHRKAKELIDNGKVSARIQVLRENLREVSDIKKERVLYQLEAIMEANIADYLTFDGIKVRFKSFDKLTKKQLYAIEGIKQNEKGEIELKLHGKSWTTDRINKMLGYEAPKKLDVKSEGLGILFMEPRDE